MLKILRVTTRQTEAETQTALAQVMTPVRYDRGRRIGLRGKARRSEFAEADDHSKANNRHENETVEDGRSIKVDLCR